MSFGGRGKGFRTCVNAAYRTLQNPGGKCHQRLHREIQFSTKSSTDSRRYNSNLLQLKTQNLCHFSLIHVRRLCADKNFQALTNLSGITCFRFNITMLYCRSCPVSFRHCKGFRKSFFNIIFFQQTFGQNIVWNFSLYRFQFSAQSSIPTTNCFEWFPC